MEDFQNSISLTNLLQSSNLAIPHLSSQQSIIAFGKYLRLCSIEALNYDLRQRALTIAIPGSIIWLLMLLHRSKQQSLSHLLIVHRRRRRRWQTHK